MATLLATNAIPVPQITIAAASILAGYVLVGSFTLPLELLTIVSTMDQAVQISFGGVVDHQAVPIGNTVPSIIQLNFKTNLTVLPVVSVYVKRIGTPTVGALYIGGFSAAIP